MVSQVYKCLKKTALDHLEAFFHPLTGGDEGRGWPVGRWVYLSEVYQQLDQVPGVDYVEGVKITSVDVEEEGDNKDPPSSIKLEEHQLVQFQRADAELSNGNEENK